MLDYMVLTVMDDKKEDVVILCRAMAELSREGKAHIIYVGSLEKVSSSILNEELTLPFSSFVYNDREFDEAMARDEGMIFYDPGSSKFETCMHIMENTAACAMLNIGNHEKIFSQLVIEALPNVLSCLIFTENGNKIFPYPRSLEFTNEAIMDALINVDSLTANSYFDRKAPFALVREKNQRVDYDMIMKKADVLGIDVRLLDEEEAENTKDVRAILSISDLGHGDDLTLYFGLPFWYINAVRLPDKAFRAALRIIKIIERGNL